MARNPSEPKKPRNIDNPNLETRFADNCLSVMAGRGAVYITLSARQTDPARMPEFNNVVSARLAITVEGAIGLLQQLNYAMNQLEKDGVISRSSQGRPTIQ